MASTASFAATPRVGCGRPVTADTSFTAPAAAVSVFVAGTNGSRIHRIHITALATTTAGMVNLFVYDGTNYRCIASVDVDAITVAAGTPPFQAILTFPEGLVLAPSGGGTLYDELVATTYNGDDFDVVAFGGDL